MIFSGISWLEFLSVAVPLLVVVNVIFMTVSRRGGGEGGEDMISRFSAKPVTDDMLPSDEEGFVSNDNGVSSDSEDLLQGMELKSAGEKPVDELSLVENKRRREESGRSDTPMDEGFDEAEQQKEMIYEELPDSFVTSYLNGDENPFVNEVSGGVSEPGNDGLVYDPQGGEDLDSLIRSSIAAVDGVSEEELKKIELCSRISDSEAERLSREVDNDLLKQNVALADKVKRYFNGEYEEGYEGSSSYSDYGENPDP